ncbi:YcaO-like family protein [Candidatus Bathyarchaeota archaeon]|nr:YcaO-like family protein [Candidatus Bathyarchaeota archaeon]
MDSWKAEVDAAARADDLLIAEYLSGRSKLFEQIVSSKRFVPSFRGFQSQRKIYKDRTLFPNDTVTWLITALRNFFRDSPFKVAHFPSLNTPSAWFADGGVYHRYRRYFRALGKGLTLVDAMASLYGEMLERIQAGFFFSRNPHKPRTSRHYEVETSEVITKEVKELNLNFYRMLKQNSVSYQGTQDVPDTASIYSSFLDVVSGGTAWISAGLFMSSTGLAGGNTYEEAFVQAFCEVLERYCAFRILKDMIRIPTIPETNCSPEIRELLGEIAELGFQAIIKDASLDFDVPVVAVLFVSKDRKTEENRGLMVCFGAASSLDVAVERCITECLQGVDNLRMRDLANSLYVEEVDRLYETFPQLGAFVSKQDYFSELFAKYNCFPSRSLAFLMEDCGRSEIKEFASSDVKDEVDFILQLARTRGFNIYMRDHGWLGFPAVRIFVPELNIGRRLWLPNISHPVDKFKEKLLTDFSSIKKNDLQIMEEPEFILHVCSRDSLCDFFQIDTLTLERWSRWAFFGMLALAFDQTDLANKYLRHIHFEIPNSKNLKRTSSMRGEEILRELAGLLPDCRKPCIECRFMKECRYTVLADFESTLVNSYPESLSRIEPPVKVRGR